MAVNTEKIRRVFVNVINNVVEAMSQGAEFTIRSKESNGYLEVMLSETGTGVTRRRYHQDMDSLLHGKGKGIALGLSIAKRAMEAHKGEISLEDAVWEGWTFTVTIPAKLKAQKPSFLKFAVHQLNE